MIIHKSILPWLFGLAVLSTQASSEERPNILWITSEDNGPHLGAYGDDYATSPNLDGLAARGMIYLNAWSTAPVCAPARTTLISGVYPPATGSQHMRSEAQLPSYMKMYPQYLRDHGYFCTNNSKKDYNLTEPGQVWDESSRQAHWKNRKEGQPFFAIFNHTISHESQIRRRPHKQVHDPKEVRVRKYHPDTADTRRDWAQYYDKIMEMDALAGKNLKELEEAGLADDTIIFYYGDHGSGMPRNKRWTYNSGLHVPLIVYVPEKYKHLAPADYQAGGQSKRLVGFIDLAPTVLSLAGIKPPGHLQGHAFMGQFETEAPDYAYGFRGRMDERYDLVRAVRDERYIYIRNYMPHRIYGQYIQYMFQTPTTRVWKEMYEAGKLNDAQKRFWETKPAEELYDLQQDPDEINNLAGSGQHAETLERFRKAHKQWVMQIRDLGFLPEEEMHHRGGDAAPYDMGHDNFQYPLGRIHRIADFASSMDPKHNKVLRRALSDKDSAVRYWGAMGFLMRGKDGVQFAHNKLRAVVENDPSDSVRVIASEALGRYGDKKDIEMATELLMEKADVESNNVFISMLALNALDYMEQNALSAKEAIAKLPTKSKNVPGRMNAYIPNLIKKTVDDLSED